jgi:hypothetical protein
MAPRVRGEGEAGSEDDDDDDDDDDEQDEAMERSLRKLENYFFAQLQKGLYPKVDDLARYCQKRKLNPRPTRKQLYEVRLRFKASAGYTRWEKTKAPHFMTDMVPKPGNIFLDLMYFGKSLARHNEGNAYALIAVDSFTGIMNCYPCKDKSRASWKAVIKKIIRGNDFPFRPRVFITDSKHVFIIIF